MIYISELKKCQGSKIIEVQIVEAKDFMNRLSYSKEGKSNNLIC